MTDELKKAKAVRVSKKAIFTRKKNHLQQLLDGEASGEKLKDSYGELAKAFEVLESAQESVLVALEEDQLETEVAYLDILAGELASMDLKVNTSLETHSQKARQDKAAEDEATRIQEFNRALAAFKAKLENFGKPSVNLAELSNEKKISFADMRLELTKLENSQSQLLEERVKVSNLDPSFDLSAVCDMFTNLVAVEVDRCKKIGLEYLKEDISITPEATAVAPTGGGSRSSTAAGYSSTKRETVMLPKFSGEEKSAYLQYPIWKKQWNSHIMEYETKYRATMLLNHLDTKALEQIVGLESDYEKAMEQLDRYYNDSKKIVKACLDEIRGHSNISPFDYKALVLYKKCLVNNFTRLKACDLEHELSNTAALSVLVRKLPIQEAVEWQRFLAKKDQKDQAKPFPSFMSWLEEAGSSWELMAASGTGVKGKSGTQVHHSFFNDGEITDADKNGKPCFKCGQTGHWRKNCPNGSPGRSPKSTGGGKSTGSKQQKERDPPKNKKYHCALHKDAPGKACYSWSCTALKYTPFDERLKLLRANGDCERCCGDCPKGNCQAKFKRTCGGGKEGRGCGSNHLGHELYCKNAKLCFSTQFETVLRTEDEGDIGVLLQVMKIPSISPSKSHETVLWDTACTGMFVRHSHAKEMEFPFEERKLRVVTLGGRVEEIDGVIYHCSIKDQNGKIYKFFAHGLDTVTGHLGDPLSKDTMKKLFPDIIGAHTMTGASSVDYMIGLGKASWQPQRLQKALGGGDFWLWGNEFGTCVGGSHPLVNSFTTRSDTLYTVMKTLVHQDAFYDSLRIPTCNALSVKVSNAECNDFFNLERLGTSVEPRCGACRCGKCPIPGSRFSFREESELKMISDNLTYDEERGCWVAKYPFMFPRELLKGDREIAFKSMLSVEKMLHRKGDWSKVYQSQIEDMLQRGVVRVVSDQDMERFQGHVNYLPHLAALNPKSESTPVRICFDASRPQGGGPSLNQVLAKGPDRYLNNLAGVIVNFRSGRVAAKGDVRKMYNCVQLSEEDAYLQCFLWRDLDASQEPKIYQVVVNNIGVKPAGAIAALALQKSSDLHADSFPVTSRQLKEKSYVDDVGLTAEDSSMLKQRTSEADIILKHANMAVKKWIYSGDVLNKFVEVGEIDDMAMDDTPCERMLGVSWDPSKDVFRFSVKINLSPLKNKSRMGPGISKEELMQNPPKSISRRQYYSQIQSLFDPIGLLAPILLKAKVLLRMTWEGDCEKLKWDDDLPSGLVKQIVEFFIEMYDIENLEFPRSLWPRESVIGQPELVVFSDGSVLAFGTTAYIRWKLCSGKWWSMLVMSKSKIAPKHRITVPRLELNGAVLGKRLKEFIVGELDLDFANIYHLVDSSTVLGYLHKPDAKLKPFEGIRVSEVQTSGEFIDGRLKNWSWVESNDNPADWATKPRTVSELKIGGFWQSGPSFLATDFDRWPVKLDFKTERLDGELLPKNVHVVCFVSEDLSEVLDRLLQNTSNTKKLFNVVARMLKWKSLIMIKDGRAIPGSITVEEVQKARKFWIKYEQAKVEEELCNSISQPGEVKVHGKFKRLSMFKDTEGIWRVGLRMREFAPFTADKLPPAFIPRSSRLAQLLMEQAHRKKHCGVDETVATFRLNGYWTTQASKLAKKVKSNCITCRYLDRKPMEQMMGSIPKDQMVQPIAWGDVELDLFGPFTCRGDVNKRSSIKVWGIVVVDKNSGASHCDILMDYSAQETLKALRRFAALRGWPSRISSDPGSQLESSSGRLHSWWEDMRSQFADIASEKGFEWVISPSNSPWRQGKSEVRIKVIKRLLKIAIGSTRLSPTELQTVLFEAANLANDRPLGVVKTPRSDGSFPVITPNCLLLGRSSNSVPDDANIAAHMKHSDRYSLIQQVTSDFWSLWAKQVTPESVIRQKWHTTGRNLTPGDIVLLHEKTPIKGKYCLGIVKDVKQGRDDLVRSCSVEYTIPNAKDTVGTYTGGRKITVTRSIQRLTLLLPVEEQIHSVEIVNGKVRKSEENKGQADKKDKIRKSCEGAIVEKSVKDKNIVKSCKNKMFSHMVKSSCIDTSQDLVAEATYVSTEDLVAEAPYVSTEDLVAEATYVSTEDLAAEEGRFLVKVQSESGNVAENLSVSRIFKEDLVAEERTSSLE